MSYGSASCLSPRGTAGRQPGEMAAVLHRPTRAAKLSSTHRRGLCRVARLNWDAAALVKEKVPTGGRGGGQKRAGGGEAALQT